MKNLQVRTRRLFLLLISSFIFTSIPYAAKGGKNIPTVEETEKGPTLMLPEALEAALAAEFPASRLPAQSEFNPDMVSYYFSRLIGIHPAIAWGDFNGDKKTDYAVLLVTSQGTWGPLVELVIMNGESRQNFTSFRLGEIYNFKDDYVSFREGKLYKGRYKKGGWYINWNKKDKTYSVSKS